MSGTLFNIGDNTTTSELVQATSTTGTSAVNGTGFDLKDYTGQGIVVMQTDSVSGTSPTLDVKVQDSADNSSFADVSGLVFAQVVEDVATTTALSIQTKELRRYIRVVYTPAGTNPVFDLAVSITAAKQRTG